MTRIERIDANDKFENENARKRRVREFSALIDQLSESIQISRQYTRDELNERR